MKVINADRTNAIDLPDTLAEILLKRSWVKITDSDYRAFVAARKTRLETLTG